MKKANSGDKPLVVEILSRAFNQNPSVNYVVKQDHKRSERVRRLMEYSFDLCNTFGAVYLSQDQKACALIMLPDMKRTMLKTLILDLKLLFTVIGLSRIKRILAREAKIHNGYPKEPIFYLWFLGVEPECQGKGIGSSLLKQVLEESRRLNRRIYLETSVPENIPFYFKHGFEVYTQLKFDQVLYCLRHSPE